MPTVPDAVKQEVEARAAALIETALVPAHCYPRPKDWRWSYPIDLYTRWWRHYLSFCATYVTPHPEAVPPTREARFARLEYRGANLFNLAYMRHTGEWAVVYENRSLTGCLRASRGGALPTVGVQWFREPEYRDLIWTRRRAWKAAVRSEKRGYRTQAIRPRGPA